MSLSRRSFLKGIAAAGAVATVPFTLSSCVGKRTTAKMPIIVKTSIGDYHFELPVWYGVGVNELVIKSDKAIELVATKDFTLEKVLVHVESLNQYIELGMGHSPFIYAGDKLTLNFNDVVYIS